MLGGTLSGANRATWEATVVKAHSDWSVVRLGPVERLEDAPRLTTIIPAHHDRVDDRPTGPLRRVAAFL